MTSTHVNWTLYKIEGSSIFEFDQTQNPEPPIKNSLQIEIHDKLNEAANVLRSNGFHTLYCVADEALWLFEVSTDPLPDEFKTKKELELASLIDTYNLTCEP